MRHNRHELKPSAKQTDDESNLQLFSGLVSSLSRRRCRSRRRLSCRLLPGDVDVDGKSNHR